MIENDYLHVLVFTLIIIFIISVFFVTKIAKDRRLDLKRWLFYAFYFNVFALIYLLLIQKKSVNSSPSEDNAGDDL
jgi:hypothetical protein